MEMKGLMGGFYRISEWIMRFSVTNLLWLLTSIPVWFFILSMLMNEELDLAILQSTFVIVAIIAPFTLFPSTSAMFSLARKWLTGDEDAPLFKTFFINYRRNYVQSMLAGILYMIIFITLFVNYQFYMGLENNFQLIAPLFLAFMLVASISVFNFFSLQSHLHMKTIALLKNALLLTIGKPITSILIVVTNVSIIYISFSFFNAFLAFFFMGSLVAYMTFFHFQRMFQKIQDKQEEMAEAEQQKAETDIADGKKPATIETTQQPNQHESLESEQNSVTETKQNNELETESEQQSDTESEQKNESKQHDESDSKQ